RIRDVIRSAREAKAAVFVYLHPRAGVHLAGTCDRHRARRCDSRAGRGEHLMSEAISGLFWLRDPQLAPLALGPSPAWPWSLDGPGILFANPTGAAIFGAETPQALAARRFEGNEVAARIVRLAAILPGDGENRIESLRGFGAGLERTLTCRCAHT